MTKKKNIVFDNVALATQAVIDGLGIFPMHRPLADPKINEGKLEPAHPYLFQKEESYYFIFPLDYESLPAVKLFRIWLVTEAERFQRSWLEKMNL